MFTALNTLIFGRLKVLMQLFIPAHVYQQKVCYSSVSRELTWISNRQLRTSHFLLNPDPLRHASHPVLSRMLGAPLHAWATLYRRSVTAALMLPLSDRIAQVEIASRQTERKSVCDRVKGPRLIERLESEEEVYFSFRVTGGRDELSRYLFIRLCWMFDWADFSLFF